MTAFGYPTSVELTAIGQDFLSAMTLDDPIFQYFPIVNSDSHLLEWEQRDNYKGLQLVRGLDGEPGRVAAIGGKRYIMEPGVYGEFLPINEDEITKRRRWGTFGDVMPIGDLVAEKQEQLVVREVARIRQILWALATAGTFSVTGPQGAVLHTDAYTFQSVNGTTWATVATATPLADFRAVALKGRGTSASFGRGATAFMNQVTANSMLGNTNASDLAGRLRGGGNTFNSVADFNAIYTENDLPLVRVMDEGYYDDSGTFQLFIPDGTVVVFGARPGNQALGEYRRTRNANNPDGAPGSYDVVYESPKPPKTIEVHRGMNGGPVIWFPSAITVLDAS
jgi:hypothetical protein